MRRSTVILALSLLAGLQVEAAAAIRCDKLQPIPPQDSDRTFTGKMSAAVDGWFAKLAKVGGAVEGTYREVGTNVLAQFPQADHLYMWERVLYLKCQLIAGSNDLSTQEKLQSIDALSRVSEAPPPPIAAVPSNTATNSGDHATIIQGNGNSVSNGK